MSLTSQYLSDVQALAEHREAQLKFAANSKHKDLLWQIYSKDVSSVRSHYFGDKKTDEHRPPPLVLRSLTKPIRTSPPPPEAIVRLRATGRDPTDLNSFGKVLAEATDANGECTVVTYSNANDAAKLRAAILDDDIGWELDEDKSVKVDASSSLQSMLSSK